MVFPSLLNGLTHFMNACPYPTNTPNYTPNCTYNAFSHIKTASPHALQKTTKYQFSHSSIIILVALITLDQIYLLPLSFLAHLSKRTPTQQQKRRHNE
jgi:hypothetical protein